MKGEKTVLADPLAGPEMVSGKGVVLTIKAPNFQVATFKIINEPNIPLVINRFSIKARNLMMDAQAAGARAKSKKVREPKDFDLCYEEAKHVSMEGWEGISASAFRSAMVSACRATPYVMTKAKLAIRIVADGTDRDDGTPLVRIYGESMKYVGPVRNQSGVADIRARPMYREWYAFLRVRYDADMMSQTDVANLLVRAGSQVGVGEGRPNSPDSCGCEWGAFVTEEATPDQIEKMLAK